MRSYALSLSLAAAALAASALPAAAGTLLVPQQFPTIQAALNAAKPYDTVLVSPKPGGAAYAEAVTLSTSHVLLQGRNGPVLDGSTLGVVVPQPPPFASYTAFPNGVQVKADHVAVCGLTVQGFGFGDGPFSPSAAGIDVAGAADVQVSGNTLKKNSTGLTIEGFNAQRATLKGYYVLGNLITGNSAGGAALSGASVLVAGNRITGNHSAGDQVNASNSDGLDVSGTGITVSGNEVGNNDNYGINVTDAAGTYNPAINDPKNPNPAPTVTAFNYVHGNGNTGLQVQGTQTIFGNAIVGNTGQGVSLNYADFSAVTGNLISGTTLAGYSNDGVGIYAADSATIASDQQSGLKISGNQISGNAGDGVFFDQVAGGVISGNCASGNQGIGIHLSDYSSDSGYDDYAPTTVTQNQALRNVVFDARDDAAASGYVLDGAQYYYGDSLPLFNVWTKDQFGTTDPAGLGK